MENFNQQPKTPEQISENIVDLVKTGNFNKIQLDNLITKLQKLNSEKVSDKNSIETPSEQKQSVQELNNKAIELRKKLPENQANTRTQATKDLLDFAADLYDVPKYSDSLESGKYITWIQDLGVNGYNASMLLNAPQRALDELLKLIS